MMSLGSCNRQRAISMRWRSPADKVQTGRSGLQAQAIALVTPAMRSGRSARLSLLGSTRRDVLGHRQIVEQREVLENHADPAARAASGLAKVDRLAIQRMTPSVGSSSP